MNRLLRLYTPPARIVEVPGVRKQSVAEFDFYTGHQADLVSAGVLPASMFPGELGLPLTSVVYWPTGVQPDGNKTPGRMRVVKSASGKFTIALAVSKDEQERRKAESAARARAIAESPSHGPRHALAVWRDEQPQRPRPGYLRLVT
jgi:hypothetical protein